MTKGLLPEADIDAATKELRTAFVLCGLVGESTLRCPSCGTEKRKKVELKARHWKCYRCGSWGSSTKLVQEHLGVNFPTAVNMLLGRHEGSVPKARVRELTAKVEVADSFKASTEPWVFELYTNVLHSKHCSLKRAQRFWAEFHIDPSVVEEQQSRYITDPAALKADLEAQYSRAQLIESGLFIEKRTDDDTAGELRMLAGWNYPVIEPAIDARGRVRNMQFRASAKQRAKVLAHKRGTGKYVPPFMSIKGATEKHLIGCGIERLAQIEGRTVYVVEGFKDLLAARTMGAEAFAMPGTGILPPPGVVQFLADRGHAMLVALDGDDAGTQARPVTAEHFRMNGFAAAAADEHGFDVVGLRDNDLLTAYKAGGDRVKTIAKTIAAEHNLSSIKEVIDHDDAAAALRTKLDELFVNSCRVKMKTDMPDGMDVADILAARIAEQVRT